MADEFPEEKTKHVKDKMHDLVAKPERAMAVSVGRKGANRDIVFEYLKELESLAETAGAEIVEKVYQELDQPNRTTMVGSGKLEEIKLSILENGIVMLIFDDDLSPMQVRNLEKELKIKVIDRSGLILDIFAKHARTNEAKLQVELAQLQYILPRLTRMWTHLSKQFSGVGTKGPGETQIETDRRALKQKVIFLKDKLEDISAQKEQQNKGRADLPRFSFVGYTNVGKSTLMNTLTEAGVYVENKLFATLDTTVRSFNFPNGQKALLADTVGFIRKLPSHLVASFRSTLKEAEEADVLVHVVDISHEYFEEQIKVVNDTLELLKIGDKPTLIVFNKIDALDNIELIRSVESEYPKSIFVSAKRGINLTSLIEAMQAKYDENSQKTSFMLPYESMQLINDLYTNTDIVQREDREEGIYFEVKIQPLKQQYFNHVFKKFLDNNEL